MSDKFKFTSKERNIIYEEAHLFREDELSFQTMFDRIESIIQDRGNSIEDGWIDVEEQKPKQDTTVIVFDGNQVALAHFDDYYEGEAEWQYLDGTPYKPLPIKWQPLPSAPKQPKK